ncbi:MAG: hypothetical protein HFG20_09690 [Anaerotruncus sp.]|jgi:hypothetical protein|nr:hypothetical protein [Anaerotruncus sp.]
MAFKVKLFSGAPDFEALHVAKITNFPLEPRDYKPYSQARICFAGDGLHLQLLAFEATPLPLSLMRVELRFPDCPNPLSVILRADGNYSVCRVWAKDVSELSVLHAFTGEDLQGVYWGGNILVSNQLLGEYFSSFEPRPGKTFSGNFYKICVDPKREHYGSYFPADFQKTADHPDNLGEFVIIDY